MTYNLFVQAEELAQRGWLGEPELQALAYVSTLEAHYPMCKFERAQSVYTRSNAK